MLAPFRVRSFRCRFLADLGMAGDRIGFVAAVSVCCVAGSALTALIALWPLGAPANMRPTP